MSLYEYSTESTDFDIGGSPRYTKRIERVGAGEMAYSLYDHSYNIGARCIMDGGLSNSNNESDHLWNRLQEVIDAKVLKRSTMNIKQYHELYIKPPTTKKAAAKKSTKPRSKKVKAKAITMNRPINIFNRLKLNIKLKIPHTVKLTKKESGILISNWEKQSNETATNTTAMIRIGSQTENQIRDISSQITRVTNTLNDAKKAYAKAKTDEEKEIIERRIVLSGETRDQLIASQDRLNKVVTRVKETIEDAHLAKLTLDSRTDEARIYRELEGGLKLVGESLAHAREQHVVTKDEHSKFELSMGALDSKITTRSRTSLSKSAQKYLNEKPRKKDETVREES